MQWVDRSYALLSNTIGAAQSTNTPNHSLVLKQYGCEAYMFVKTLSPSTSTAYFIASIAAQAYDAADCEPMRHRGVCLAQNDQGH